MMLVHGYTVTLTVKVPNDVAARVHHAPCMKLVFLHVACFKYHIH